MNIASKDVPILNLISTGFLPIARVSYSSYGLMTFVIARPFIKPLFLGSISIQVIAGGSIVTGSITEGSSASSPGRANLQVSQDIYDNLLAIATSTVIAPAATHLVQLIFDELTYAPTAITVI